jgi:hypothetical protein
MVCNTCDYLDFKLDPTEMFPTLYLRTDTDAVSELLFPLEYWMMDKVQMLSNLV